MLMCTVIHMVVCRGPRGCGAGYCVLEVQCVQDWTIQPVWQLPRLILHSRRRRNDATLLGPPGWAVPQVSRRKPYFLSVWLFVIHHV